MGLNAYLAWAVEVQFGALLLELIPIYLASIVLILAGFLAMVLLYPSKNTAKNKDNTTREIPQTEEELTASTAIKTTPCPQEKAVLDHLTSGIIILNSPTNVLLINHTAASLIGHKKDKELFYFIADTEFYAIIEAQENATIYRKIDNQTYSFRFSFETDTIIVLIEDVTRLKAAEEIKNEFIANVTHEMNTPLTSIAGYADLIKQGLNEDNTKKAADTIISQSRRLGGLIKSILNYSQIDALEIDPYLVDMSQTTKESLLSLAPYVQEKKIELKSEIEDGVVVDSRHEYTMELINNLVTNAIKYNKEGGSVTVTLTKSPKVLTVEDSGVGIKEEDMQRIFDRFYKVDTSQNGAGYGLGLAIVKKIALKNNWKISVESVLNKGTKFKVEF